jgi:hypothetical protein
MAKWDTAASTALTECKRALKASDSEIADLKAKIAAWADKNADGSKPFPFKGTVVTAVTTGGWIRRVDYGN